MHRPGYLQVFVGVGLALSLLGLFWVSLARSPAVLAQSAKSKSAATSVTTTLPLEPIGRLYFTDSAALQSGSFLFAINELPPPPANSHYELWLHSEETSSLRLGALDFADGMATLQGSIGYNPLTAYDQAQLSLAADDTNALSIPVLLTATLPAPLRTALTQLLDTSASPWAESEVISGLMTGAEIQAQLALKHTGFLREQLNLANLPEARRHTEHIINILDGETGAMYSDLDRNGQLQNPGDGVGVRVYLDEARPHLLDLRQLLRNLPGTQEQQAQVMQSVAAIQASQTAIPAVFDKAPKIFASDTVTEANEHAHDLNVIIEGLVQKVNTAYQDTLGLATYTFYRPATPLPVPTAAAPRATATRTPTPASATPKPTATAGITSSAVPTVPLVPTLAVDALAHDHTGQEHTAVPASPLIEIDVPVEQGWRNPADGSLYIRVPAGEFVMGSTGATATTPREQPQHSVAVAEFWLQQSETTNSQYQRCVLAGVCTAPADERWNDPAYANHPVAEIDWQQARTYAEWVGGRLPTEAEWEAACRGAEAREFPWGDSTPTADLSNFNGNVGNTTAVGSYPAGASPLGLVDLSGNVWEWVNTLDARYPYSATDGREATAAPGKRIARGGSFYYTQYQIRCAARTGFDPQTQSQPIGLRVALDGPVTRWLHPADEAFYVYIPGGEFAMGSTPASAVSPQEEPRHPVTVGDFWLQETETTNEQYGRCIAAGACTVPANTLWDDPAYADHPVINITWQQANEYATWAGGRLPTEAEWEKACRGPEGRTYPWGEEPPTEELSNYNNAVGDTTPVGSYPTGASAAGALDLSGNVWEWVSSLDTAYPYDATDGREAQEAPGERSVRGGSFYYTQYQIRCAARTGFAPDTADQPIGMRVVLDTPQ